MRIIAGNYRGKKLFTPESKDIRPTADRAREAIFNIINSNFIDSWAEIKLVDVFCGSGAFGLEAVSRGAENVCLIDKDITLSSKNANLFPKEKAKVKMLKANALNLPFASSKYNMVFIDAPYEQNMSEKTLCELLNKGWLAEYALCVVEVNRREDFIIPQGFSKIDERIYGIAKFIFLELSK